MFSPSTLMSWKLTGPKPLVARPRSATPVTTIDLTDPPTPALRLATPNEVDRGEALRALARRCGVPDSYEPLLAVLENAVSSSVDLVIANGQDDHPVLIAVDRSAVSIVDPSLAVPGVRGQVISQAFLSIRSAQLVKGAVGGRRMRWFVLEADTPVRIELSKEASEAASQVVYEINQRIESARRRALLGTVAPRAAAG